MNYIETCTKIAVFLWRSSNYRPLKSVLHVRPGWIIYQNMRETWEKKVMKFEHEIPIGLDARRKKRQGGGWKSPPPPNGIRVKWWQMRCMQMWPSCAHLLLLLLFRRVPVEGAGVPPEGAPLQVQLELSDLPLCLQQGLLGGQALLGPLGPLPAQGGLQVPVGGGGAGGSSMWRLQGDNIHVRKSALEDRTGIIY